MALVLQQRFIDISIIDSGAQAAGVSYEMTAADDIIQASDALIVIAAFEAVCAAGTIGYTLRKTYGNDALVVPIANNVQKEIGAVITLLDNTNPLKKHSLRIPAPENDVFLATTGDGQNIVDIAHADVVTFCDLFSTGGELLISDGESSEDAVNGGIIRGFRKTRRNARG